MTVAMLLLCIGVFILLLLVSGFVPTRSELSVFELERRKKKGDQEADKALQRETFLTDVLSLQRVISALLLVVLVSLLVATFGWFLGILLSLLVALEYGSAARLAVVQACSQRMYEAYETSILRLAQKHGRGFLRLIRNISSQQLFDKRIDSREELEHLVVESGGLLTADEKKLIVHGLTFSDKEVKQVMTPRGVIDSINKKELLGPLVLDDLHKTGHSRFPVIDGDIDHVVGMLYIHNLFTLDAKQRSLTAEKVMEPKVYYIREDHTLEQALAGFLRTHHHLFIVINEFRETVGVLSLEDVIEALIGRNIADEFDAHDDLRAVAERNPRGNNKPKKHEDV